MKARYVIAVLLLSWVVTATSTPLGTAFIYQGRLNEENLPANGSYDFRFQLSGSADGTGTVGSPLVRTVPVTNGLFTVNLDFGSGIFAGSARWLAIEVKTNDPGNALSYALLLPRQELKPSPYAMHASDAEAVPWSGVTGLPAGFGDGVDNDTLYSAGKGLVLNGTEFVLNYGGDGAASSVAHSDHTHFGQYWSGDGDIGLEVSHGGGALGTAALSGIIPASSAAVFSTAVKGANHTSSANGYGVYGQDDGTGAGVLGAAANGRGVFGASTYQTGVEGSSETGYGVLGRNTSPDACQPGVTGLTASIQNEAAGVRGEIQAANAGILSAGVRGHSAATSPATFGVYGTHAHAGTGVGGSSQSGTGVWGNSSNGTGVRGASDTGTGVWGSSSTGSFLVLSPFEDLLGNGAGVEGLTGSLANDAAGVRGEVIAFDAGSGSSGVFGVNYGGGFGVSGEAAAGTGVMGTGLNGVAGTATSGTAMDAFATVAGGVGIRARAASASDIALEIHTGGLKVRNAGVGTSTPVFIQKVAAGNIGGGGLQNWTIINNPLCNNNPTAILIVTHNYNPGNTGFISDANPLGVNYDMGTGRWSIFHPNGAAMVVGTAYNVLIFKP